MKIFLLASLVVGLLPMFNIISVDAFADKVKCPNGGTPIYLNSDDTFDYYDCGGVKMGFTGYDKT